MTDEEKISRRYRELGAEEPPRALDDVILAAARRRPQRSYAPLATAAVLVLAMAVALHTQIEQPDTEVPVPRVQKEMRPAAQPAAKTEAPAKTAKRTEPQAFAPQPVAPAAPTSAPASAPVEAASASGAIAGLAAERDARADRAEATVRRPAAAALSFAETPERELERIAALRVQGRHDEADRALAEFRKRYPDYRIAEEMRVRVERR